jgi:AsmA protein
MTAGQTSCSAPDVPSAAKSATEDACEGTGTARPSATSHKLLRSALIAVVAGLPIAVEMSSAPERFPRHAAGALADGTVPVLAPVPLSNLVALTLDAGRVTPAGTDPAADKSGARIVVDDGRLTLDLSHPAPGPVVAMPEAERPLVARIGGLSAGALVLRNATLTIVGGGGGRYAITDVAATLTAPRRGNYKLVGTGRYNGKRLSIEGTWSDPHQRDGQVQMPLRLSLRSAFLDVTFDGALSAARRPTLVGHAEVRVPSVGQLSHWIGFGRAIGEHVRSIGVAGPVEWNASRMAFARASVDVDGSLGSGALVYKLDGPRPAIDATLAFAEVDFGRLLSPVAGGAPKPGKPQEDRFFRMLDADLRFSVDRIKAGAVETGRGAMTVALNDGRLQADLVGLEIEGGKADAQLTLDVKAATPKAVVKVKAKGVDSGRLLAASLRRNPLLGRTNITFEGTAEGSTLSETVLRLAGRGSFELSEPGRLGLDIAALTYAAKTSPVVGWAAAGKGSTALDRLACKFRVVNGAITVETLQARSGDQTLQGSGQIDIPGRLMDVSVATGSAVQGEAQTAAPALLSLRGNWSDPAISLVREEPAKAAAAIRSH